MKTDLHHCCANCANWKKQRIDITLCVITGIQCYWWEGTRCKIFKRKKGSKK